MPPTLTWTELYNRFDPERPANDPELRASRPDAPSERMALQLGLPVVDHRLLLIGTKGTGKSTELLRLAESRARADFVVLLDLAVHFRDVVGDDAALQRISSWEVVFLAGLAIRRAAEERLDIVFPVSFVADFDQAWRALASVPESPDASVDLAKVARSMVVLASTAVHPVVGGVAAGALTVLDKATDAVKWNVKLGHSIRHDDQDVAVRNLRDAVNNLIGEVQRQASPILLIVDGLDRIDDLERARALFVDSTLMARLACKTVLCGPFALRHHPALANVGGLHQEVLANERVLDEMNPAEMGPGVAFFCDLFTRRVAPDHPDSFLSDELVRRLAYYSGGRARDFVKLVRQVALEMLLSKGRLRIAKCVEQAIDAQRRILETGMHAGHVAVLQEVRDDAHHRLPDNVLVWELLRYNALLPYPDGSEWYYPHPLLTLNLL